MDGNKNGWWKPAVEIFSQVSGWIVAPVVVAVIGGKWLDARYGTKPLIFLALVGAAFLISCFGIFRVIRKYIKEIEDLGNKKSKEN